MMRIGSLAPARARTGPPAARVAARMARRARALQSSGMAMDPQPRPRSPLTAEELAAVRRPFRGATLLPARTYHDPAIFALEREEWFFREWICVGREEDAPDPGTYFTLDLVGEPLVAVRG